MCQVSVGVLGDVCRAIEEQIAPHMEAIMKILLRNLESNDVQRNIKPQILSAFGDVALAIGDRFEMCIGPCLHMLQSAQVLAMLFSLLFNMRDKCLESCLTNAGFAVHQQCPQHCICYRMLRSMLCFLSS